MATTKIWDVKGWIGRAVIYVENPEKTENPNYIDSGKGDSDIQHMQDVMEYAMTDERAKEFGHVIEYAVDGKKTEQQHFVSALNCRLESARADMTATKLRYGKTGGNTAYHAIQSFVPGEVTPETAHEIGIKLAQKLWGERFEVVIATHLDKNHIHNHFVLNSVSFKDGYKFYDSERFWRQMARASDTLCKEYSLEVITNPVFGRSKHYAELKAEREGKPTWRTILKSEIDEVIKMSMTESQFLKNLKARGYEYKTGKHFAVRPPGSERFHRLETKLGEAYSLAGINKMINAQERPIIPAKDPPRQVRHYRMAGSFKTTKKFTGFRALYVHYLFLLGKIPQNNPRKQNPNRIYYIYREDLRKLDRYANEIKLLTRNRIDTSEQLFSYKEGLTAQIKPLAEQRKSLYNKLRRLKGEPQRAAVKSEIAVLSKKIRQLRKEVGLCDDIAVHTQEMKAKMAKERRDKNLDGKENTKHEPIR